MHIFKRFKSEEIEVREETRVEFASLFQTMPFFPRDFWFTTPNLLKRNESASDVNSIASYQSGQSSDYKQQKTQVKKKLKNKFFVLKDSSELLLF